MQAQASVPQPMVSVPDKDDRMDDSLSIREAAKSDLPDLLRLYSQPELDNGDVLPVSSAERIFERMASYPNYKVYVALKGTLVVGTFALLIMDSLGGLGVPSAIIEDVAVDPAHQGQGIGREMMRKALELAAENGCYKAALSSNLRRERAHAFYESLGFERHGYSFRIDIPERRT
jgi:ribosomal protein S18 acetylase RimI-like enzyme